MIRKLFLALALTATMSAAATQITVGSYNIRTLTAADLGNTHWDQRKSYVARTVTDAGMTVVGFNEVMSNRQRTELIDLMPAYTFSGWDGVEGYGGAPTAINLVAFRTDMYELLDEGFYFLARTLDRWEESWDNSECTRETSWVKLKVKETGEIFYFFCTHLDHHGNIARMMQAHLNYAQAWEIAGHYPIVMVGDQNSNTTRVNYINLYKAGFTDAFSIIENPAEKFGKADPATSGQWNENPTAGRRIDYIWVRGMNVDSYDHCTNTYDLGVMPSDHIAITATLTYVDPDINNRYRYVSPGASGNGTKESPFGTIQEAVASAGFGDTIFVAAGDYEVEKQIDVKKSVRIFGGYDEAFEQVTGRSNVKAVAEVRPFMLRADTDVEMRNIGVYGGNPTAKPEEDGGGICAHGARLILRDCEIADNTASRDGGGIDCTGQLILERVNFLRNKAGRNGGGFCCDKPNKRYWFNFPVENCLFDGNEATDGSAAYLPRFVYCHIAGNTFVNNVATDGSTLHLLALSSSATSPLADDLTVFNNTFALNRASGAGHASAIYVEIDADAQFSLVNNTIVSNSSADGVAAVYMQQGAPCIAGNIIAGNTGGDVFLNTAKGVSAAFNVYTTAESVNYKHNAKDILSADFAAAAAGLARVLDGEVKDGIFVPNLTLPAEDDAAESAAATVAPSIKVVNPAWSDTQTLCSLGKIRLREDVVKGDFNFDCMKESSVYMATDQAGVARPLTGTATIGAREYTVPAAIDNVWAEDEGESADRPEEYFDLQGRRVANPANGIYIRCRGTQVEKVVVR